MNSAPFWVQPSIKPSVNRHRKGIVQMLKTPWDFTGSHIIHFIISSVLFFCSVSVYLFVKWLLSGTRKIVRYSWRIRKRRQQFSFLKKRGRSICYNCLERISPKTGKCCAPTLYDTYCNCLKFSKNYIITEEEVVIRQHKGDMFSLVPKTPTRRRHSLPAPWRAAPVAKPGWILTQTFFWILGGNFLNNHYRILTSRSIASASCLFASSSRLFITG